MQGLAGVKSWQYVQIVVSDMERSIDWYRRVLGFERVHEINLEGPNLERMTGIAGAQITCS